ncbi:flap endonuclease 1, putative [Plasmodium gallinaceum]|uniref:Flap endonuclease 1 n=1 Tax=Plasmodium gallinaceum TaxID=5849 RepID=A0A1J1H0D1_PLAGA|nr:flap endonuclease 1, putative [Plasmodium gallinaceum]CRG98156.1 flap endonuclease 1, putative [Plasmodium gallinaceum]
MGIKGLTKFIADAAPNAIKEIKIENLMGRIIAIDASMSLYQFIIAIRDSDQYGNLTNESGETTSHISGLMSRSIKLMENGLKPIYVFDGAPPELKGSELEKRGEKRQKAEELLQKAKEEGNLEEIKKQSGRTVRVTKKQNEEAKKLLTLMGIPVVEAPCEAESQCAFLTKYNIAHATATEDADALVFGTKILIRNLNANASSNQNKNKNSSKRGYILTEINLQQVLEGLNLTMNQFIDFCILCGCDYCDTIKGIGSKTAYNLIKEYNCIENIIQNIDKNKYQIPANFRFEEARNSFLNPKVLTKEEIKIDWNEPKIEELKDLLIKEYNFNEVRVTNYINRLLKARKATTQRRLDNFFTACTKKSTKLVIEESQKELKKKLKGTKRDITNINTKLNKKQKTENKTIKKESEKNEQIKKEKYEISKEPEEKSQENNDSQDKNSLDYQTNSESGNLKNDNKEHSLNINNICDSNKFNIDNSIYNNSNLNNNILNDNINLSCNNNTLNNNNNLNNNNTLNISSNTLNNNVKNSNNIKKANNIFLLPFCPKNVTNVKKRKLVQRC